MYDLLIENIVNISKNKNYLFLGLSNSIIEQYVFNNVVKEIDLFVKYKLNSGKYQKRINLIRLLIRIHNYSKTYKYYYNLGFIKNKKILKCEIIGCCQNGKVKLNGIKYYYKTNKELLNFLLEKGHKILIGVFYSDIYRDICLNSKIDIIDCLIHHQITDTNEILGDLYYNSPINTVITLKTMNYLLKRNDYDLNYKESIFSETLEDLITKYIKYMIKNYEDYEEDDDVFYIESIIKILLNKNLKFENFKMIIINVFKSEYLQNLQNEILKIFYLKNKN